MDNLIKEVKQMYDSKKLSKAQLSTLMNIQNQKSNWFTTKSFAATLALFIVGLFSFYYFSNQGDTLTKVANEVIYNHKKGLPTEYLANNMVDLNFKLTKLEFKVINSERLNGYSTIGGRYCSIQGKTAAQIRIKNNNVYSTLYQSNFLNIDKSKLPFKYIKDNTTVLIWIEQNVLFAMATPL